MKELENLPPFYLGETVEYITGILMPKGTRVKVTDLWQNDCGCWALCFNGSPRDIKSIGNHDGWKCPNCDKHLGYQLQIESGWKASSFRSLQKQSFPLMKFTEILKKEELQILISN